MSRVRARPLFWDQLNLIMVERNLRYENDGYPPDVPGRIIYNVTYPNECWGCGYKKGDSVCPYCGTY